MEDLWEEEHVAFTMPFYKLLQQNFNADEKEDGGLSGITMNTAARAKWLYTKPITDDLNCC